MCAELHTGTRSLTERDVRVGIEVNEAILAPILDLTY